jgi:conjugative transfer signal peptidase TraF
MSALPFTLRAFPRIVIDYFPLQSRKQRVVCATLFVYAILVCCTAHLVGVNTSPSAAPVGFYWRSAPHPERGQLVEVCLPPNVARFGVERGYINHSWRCPDWSEPVGKIIAGMPGDEVDIEPATVLKTDTLGRPINHVAFGQHKVEPGQVWLSGLARNSWDSRYWGEVPIANVIANLTPIWTW